MDFLSPSALKNLIEKGFIKTEQIEVERKSEIDYSQKKHEFDLTDKQQKIVNSELEQVHH